MDPVLPLPHEDDDEDFPAGYGDYLGPFPSWIQDDSPPELPHA